MKKTTIVIILVILFIGMVALAISSMPQETVTIVEQAPQHLEAVMIP